MVVVRPVVVRAAARCDPSQPCMRLVLGRQCRVYCNVSNFNEIFFYTKIKYNFSFREKYNLHIFLKLWMGGGQGKLDVNVPTGETFRNEFG